MRLRMRALALAGTSFLALGICAPAAGQVTQAWLQRYEGSPQAMDLAADVALDAAGSVYVTGTAEDNIRTIQYGSDGTPGWVAHHPGEAADIALDASGNVFVAGRSGGAMLLIKYDGGGQPLWVTSHGPAGLNETPHLAVDAAGSAWLSGDSASGIVTVRLDPDGNTLWTRAHSGAGGLGAEAAAIALDSTGNAYVGGASNHPTLDATALVLKYDPDGNLLWAYSSDSVRVEIADLAVDAAGKAFVTGRAVPRPGRSVSLTFALDGDGHLLWSQPQEHPDAAFSTGGGPLALGPAGGVYVLANCYLPIHGGAQEVLALRFGPDGGLVWSAVSGGATGLRSHHARDLAVDPAGNLVLTGWSTASCVPPVCETQYLTLKRGPDGEPHWLIEYAPDTPGMTPSSSASALALDALGRVHVTGSSMDDAFDRDFVTIQYAQQPPPGIYCTSKPSSLPGCAPAIGGHSSLASVSAGAGSYDVVCAPAPGGDQAGILVYTTNGALAVPLQSAFGSLCITSGPGFERLGPTLPGGTAGKCDGMYQFDLGHHLASQTTNPALVPGAGFDAQVWYRDPPSPGGANLSNALTLLLAP